MRTVAINGQILASERLDDEIAHYPPIADGHARTIGIEDAGDAYTDPVLAMIIEEQYLGAALAFVIASSDTNRVDVFGIDFRLGMNRRIALNL